ncbi:hypothetical protein [Mycoplasmopsis fermentans]|uniref:hypothetical protein n=1 Tax=Mycoplasmopsis fermentans TaxID=2115 RepID=UPI0038CD0FA4
MNPFPKSPEFGVHYTIKFFLLDQSYILGIGNIHANEILFESKISPWTKANKIHYLSEKK